MEREGWSHSVVFLNSCGLLQLLNRRFLSYMSLYLEKIVQLIVIQALTRVVVGNSPCLKSWKGSWI